MHMYPASHQELHLENNIYINNVSSMKKEADLSDLSEINRANISAPAIWKIGKIRFLIIFSVELSINPFRKDFSLMLNKLKLRKSSNSRSLSFIYL